MTAATEEARGPVGAGTAAQGTEDAAHFASRGDDKEFATVAAEAALARCALHKLADGRFLLTRTGWGLCRELGSLHEVRQLLRTMRGGA